MNATGEKRALFIIFFLPLLRTCGGGTGRCGSAATPAARLGAGARPGHASVAMATGLAEGVGRWHRTLGKVLIAAATHTGHPDVVVRRPSVVVVVIKSRRTPPESVRVGVNVCECVSVGVIGCMCCALEV